MRGPKFRIPSSGLDPIVRWMFEEMLRQQCTQAMMAKRVGLSERALNNWLRGHQPKAGDLHACVNVLGFELRAVPMDEDKEHNTNERRVPN